jgi:hypothetical protein
MAQQGLASLDELLDSLRSDLRIELELERVAGKLTSCVVFDKEKK